MNRKLNLPCCFCKQRKNCQESFLCSKAFGMRVILSLVAGVGLVVVMNYTFPHVFSVVSPDSYSVTGHPMDEYEASQTAGSKRVDNGEPAAVESTPTSNSVAHDS